MERRTFLKTAGLGTAGAILGVQHLSAMNPGDSQAPKKGAKVRLAAIGIANRGAQIINDFMNTGLCDIVALCDVDPESVGSRETIAKFPKAKLFKDFRKLFDEYGDHFDAVCIAIPDFAHFPVAMLALQPTGMLRRWEILVSLAVARAASATLNYACNRSFVFRSRTSFAGSFVRYWALVLLIAALSYVLTATLSALLDVRGAPVTVVKVAVESALFILSYRLQKKWVFG